jgi:GDP-L-fucose synthase
METDSNILLVGIESIYGKSIFSYLDQKGFTKISKPRYSTIDNSVKLDKLFNKNMPDYIILASVHEGGIYENINHPADLIYKNLFTELNIIHHAYKCGVKKLLFLASSCIYPKKSPQPIKEQYLLEGPLEQTSISYAIAKIAGIHLCQAYNKQYGCNFICGVPTNIYGPNDNFDPHSSHVVASLIRKFSDNKDKPIIVWGTGKPRREFLYSADFAEACLFLMNNYNQMDIINIGSGTDVSIYELANIINKISKKKNKIIFDISKPDGAQKKQLDGSRLKKLGWTPKIDLETGLRQTYYWYLKNR